MEAISAKLESSALCASEYLAYCLGEASKHQLSSTCLHLTMCTSPLSCTTAVCRRDWQAAAAGDAGLPGGSGGPQERAGFQGVRGRTEGGCVGSQQQSCDCCTVSHGQEVKFRVLRAHWPCNGSVDRGLEGRLVSASIHAKHFSLGWLRAGLMCTMLSTAVVSHDWALLVQAIILQNVCCTLLVRLLTSIPPRNTFHILQVSAKAT